MWLLGLKSWLLSYVDFIYIYITTYARGYINGDNLEYAYRKSNMYVRRIPETKKTKWSWDNIWRGCSSKVFRADERH